MKKLIVVFGVVGLGAVIVYGVRMLVWPERFVKEQFGEYVGLNDSSLGRRGGWLWYLPWRITGFVLTCMGVGFVWLAFRALLGTSGSQAVGPEGMDRPGWGAELVPVVWNLVLMAAGVFMMLKPVVAAETLFSVSLLRRVRIREGATRRTKLVVRLIGAGFLVATIQALSWWVVDSK